MSHPLSAIPASQRGILFLALLFLTSILLAVFQALNSPLRTLSAPLGILSLQFAATPERAFQILVEWQRSCIDCAPIQAYEGYLYAAFGLGLDYLFLVSYALTFSLGILLAAARRSGRWNRPAAVMGWLPFVAAFLDATENAALFRILLGAYSSPWPQLATACAEVKFSLLALGLGFALVAWLWPRAS